VQCSTVPSGRFAGPRVRYWSGSMSMTAHELPAGAPNSPPASGMLNARCLLPHLGPSAQGRRSAGLRGYLRILRSDTANMIPRRLGPDEYMHVDLHTRITVNAAESHSMHSAFVSSTQRGSTSAAKAEAPSRRGLVVCKVVRTRHP
jgi:hypothetical protein